MNQNMTISEMAALFKLNKQTLQYYDREHLFSPASRDPKSGYRLYAFSQVYSLALICYLKRVGFSLEQIKNYMNLRTVESAITQLKSQSKILHREYTRIMNIDSVLQRKIYYVEQKLKTAKLNDVQIRHYPQRAYLALGAEASLYYNETFYFYPTIAFYDGSRDLERPDVSFGALLDTFVGLDEDAIRQVRYIQQQKYLCFVCKGSYPSLTAQINEVRRQYAHLNLANNSIHFNLVDQFLEKNMDRYLTEIQIPILESPAQEP